MNHDLERDAVMPRPGKETIAAAKAVLKRADATLDAVERTRTDDKPDDVLAEFKRFALRHLDSLPINERTKMVRRWVAHLNTYLPKRGEPIVDVAKRVVQ